MTPSSTVLWNHPAGPDAYAIGITGDVYAPELRHGQKAIFDPAAAPPNGRDIVAVWIHGEAHPRVLRLHLALPPSSLESPELTPLLVVDTGGSSIRTMPMHRVEAVHRMIEAVD